MTRNSRALRAPQRLRTVGLTVLCLFASSHLLSSLHHVLTPHEVCAHGDLVHGDHADEEPEAPPSGIEFGPVVSGEADNHEHEHCGSTLACQAMDEPRLIASQALEFGLRAALKEGRALPQSSPSVPIVAFAPKASPPV